MSSRSIYLLWVALVPLSVVGQHSGGAQTAHQLPEKDAPARLDTQPMIPEAEHRFRVEASLTFSHFQQQVKTELGGARGERLVNEFQIGIGGVGTYRFHDNIAAGLFLRLDRGQRNAGQFAGFDAEGRTVLQNAIGGTYLEFWFGPVIQLSWRMTILEIGYAIVGVRSDKGRNDLPATSGSIDGSFSVNPSVAWLLALGGNVPLDDALDLVLKVEYRIRYYNRRGGESLAGSIQHGTQSLVPLVGIVWKW
jgi:hypothetical protein